MTTRRRVREVVLQILFEEDINPVRPEKVASEFLSRRLLKNKPLIAFGEGLLAGVRKNCKSIDEVIENHAANWSIKRMTVVDRNILRLAAHELLYAKTPAPVAINEAIELAKRYGQKNSSQFVNGILDRLNRESQQVAQVAQVASVANEQVGDDGLVEEI
jgi:transcription antitermination protein NusB